MKIDDFMSAFKYYYLKNYFLLTKSKNDLRKRNKI